MKQSDIEEYKFILYMAVGIYAYVSDLLILAIVLWVLGSISLIVGCLLAYFERKINLLKRKLSDSEVSNGH